jgi:hypothetical protein
MPKTVIVWKILELAKALYPEIERMWYMIDKETHEEYVSVSYHATINGRELFESFRINVTADSNVALVNDVLKNLERRFA